MSGIYVASRAITDRIAMWKRLRDDGWPIISTWIDEAGDSVDYAKLWSNIVDEVQSADALVAYVHRDDLPVRGVFVECGLALARNIPIYIVADGFAGANVHPSIGSWLHHPLVVRCGTVSMALHSAMISVKEYDRS